jgi:hypothetical protein
MQLWTSSAGYRDNFPFLCVDDVCASQEENVCTSRACYRDGFTIYLILYAVRWDSSVGGPIVKSRPTMAPTQPRIRWGQEGLFLQNSSNAEAKNR